MASKISVHDQLTLAIDLVRQKGIVEQSLTSLPSRSRDRQVEATHILQRPGLNLEVSFLQPLDSLFIQL